MKLIPLGSVAIAFVDDIDFERINQYRWHCEESHGIDYAVRRIKQGGRNLIVRMHRAILNAQPGAIVDHKNGDGLDNRRGNIRICSHAENMRNSKKRAGSSIYKGVYFSKHCGKWVAQITVDGKCAHLGVFELETAAAAAYNNAAIKHFKQFAKINEVKL